MFGGISWSRDLSKIAFIGEVPSPASYKNPWDLPSKPEEKKEPTEEHWQEDKYLYKEDFGELMTPKKNPAIFVYNLDENTIKRIYGINEDLHPQYPCFDEHSEGVVFSAVHLPLKKLGLIYCLNRENMLYYIRKPQFEKPKEQIVDDYMIQIGG